MIEIDGSTGEGGGQMLRTSLTLSVATAQAFRIFNIRAARKKPGLRNQHLQAVRAAARVGCAQVTGDELYSRELVFRPGPLQHGHFEFVIPTAGSVSLVLETILPALLIACGPSRLTLVGGTHNPFAPPFDFLQKAFLPLLGRMGARVAATLVRPGFYPAGGGEMLVEIDSVSRLGQLMLPERGRVVAHRARAVVSNLPLSIAQREVDVIARRLSLQPQDLEVVEETRSRGPGNVVTIELESEHVTELFTGFGQKGVPAEHVAERAADEAIEYLDADVPVGSHLADQLLVPMSMGQGGSFRTLAPTMHTLTNMDVIRKFLDVDFAVESDETGRTLITVTV